MARKIIIIAILAIAMILTGAIVVLAAQNVSNDNVPNTNDYSPTPKDITAGAAITYPNGIYLPNSGNPGSYRIHSNYTQTTDACASCHATHTAVGSSLLQWGSVFDTCMACHDGSVSTTYDVQNGNIGTSKDPSKGGAFGTIADQASHSGSSHNVTGAISIYAAPGGIASTGLSVSDTNQTNLKNGSYNNYGGFRQASWDVPFGCESCHDPHGQGGNARLLNPDVNGVSWAKYNAGTTKGVSLVDSGNGYYVTQKINPRGDTWILGFPYSDVTKIYADKTALDQSQYKLDNSSGFTKITFNSSVNGTLTADFVPSLVVTMQITNYLDQGGNKETVTNVSGMNTFCSACHTDYNPNANGSTTASGHTLTGQFAQAYRHQVGMNGTKFLTQLAATNNVMILESGNVTCETCHYAHGTNETFWSRTLPSAYVSNELAGSSALKRLPNMSVCEVCHQKGLGNQGYAANSGATIAASVVDAKDTLPGGGYVGKQACENCHSNISHSFDLTYHSVMSRPGLSQNNWQAAQNNQTSVNSAYTGLYNQMSQTMSELIKIGINPATGIVYETPDKWKNANVNTSNITVWSEGTSLNYSEIMVRGSALSSTDQANLSSTYSADKWYVVAKYNPTEGFSKADSLTEADCMTCHTTGDQSKITDSSAWTIGWLNKIAAGQQPNFELGVTCEACHGQGGNHVKAPSAKNIVNPATFTPAQQSVGGNGTPQFNGTQFDTSKSYLNSEVQAKSCATCHSDDQGEFFLSKDSNGNNTGAPANNPHFNFINGSGTVSCTTCHNSHVNSTVDSGQLTQPTAQRLCESCHGTITSITSSSTGWQTYMPVPQGDYHHDHSFNTHFKP